MCCDIQTKEFQCPICAKYFSRKFTLDAHMLIHKGEKPFMCQFCGKSFRQKGTLMRHKVVLNQFNNATLLLIFESSYIIMYNIKLIIQSCQVCIHSRFSVINLIYKESNVSFGILIDMVNQY